MSLGEADTDLFSEGPLRPYVRSACRAAGIGADARNPMILSATCYGRQSFQAKRRIIRPDSPGFRAVLEIVRRRRRTACHTLDRTENVQIPRRPPVPEVRHRHQRYRCLVRVPESGYPPCLHSAMLRGVCSAPAPFPVTGSSLP